MLQRTLMAAVVASLLTATAFADTDPSNYKIFKDVANQVQRYAYFTVFDDVGASIDNGVVTLTGKVTMPFKRDAIEKRVAKVEGVSRIDNRIEVLPVSQFDDELRYVIARAIYGNPSFWQYGAMSNPPIHIVVDRGHVTLTGVVNNNVERMLARSIATSFNALSVKSELKTEAEARAALEKVN